MHLSGKLRAVLLDARVVVHTSSAIFSYSRRKEQQAARLSRRVDMSQRVTQFLHASPRGGVASPGLKMAWWLTNDTLDFM